MYTELNGVNCRDRRRRLKEATTSASGTYRTQTAALMMSVHRLEADFAFARGEVRK
jgi:hypothetical protein